MVPPALNLRPAGAVGLGCAAVTLALAIIVVAGCQQTTRFAAGNGGSPPTAYLQKDDAPAGATPVYKPLPPRAIPPIPPAASAPPPGVADGRYPLAWYPAAAPRPWQFIVIHHSATADGGAARFDAEHREKGWDELGYHFVVGNGTDTRDGQIEVGSRWPKQKQGAHAKTPDNHFNERGIGICLVGNFENGPPTAQQVAAVETLVAFLIQRYHIPPDHVIGHEDTGKNTACPGRYLEAMLPTIRRVAAREAANNYAAVTK